LIFVFNKAKFIFPQTDCQGRPSKCNALISTAAAYFDADLQKIWASRKLAAGP
jgi:hypothetical protein